MEDTETADSFSKENDLKKKIGSFSCLGLFYEWRKCMSAYNQFHQVYIYGQFSPCTVEKRRLINCMKWKSIGRNRDTARDALLKSYDDEQTNMCNPDVPWTLRKDPSSDWKD